MTASYNLSQLGSNYLQGGTGSVARTTASKLQESVSVLDFGADPTGATDSTTAITNAAAAAAGKILKFPAGTYKWTGDITPATNSNWQGDGWTTVLQAAGSTSRILFTNSHSGLRDMLVLGSNSVSGSYVGTGIQIGTTSFCGWVDIRNVGVQYFQTGVRLAAALWSTFTFCQIGYCQNCVDFNAGSGSMYSTTVVFRDCNIQNADRSGVAASYVPNSNLQITFVGGSIQNNNVVSPGSYPQFTMGGTAQCATSVNLDGVYFENTNAALSIDASGIYGFVMKGCFVQSGTVGISATGSPLLYAMITGNYFSGLTGSYSINCPGGTNVNCVGNDRSAYPSATTNIVTGTNCNDYDTYQPALRYTSSGSINPTLIGSTTAGTQTYTFQNCVWNQIGNVVFFAGRVDISAKDGAMAGNVLIGLTGMPVSATLNNAYSLVTVTPNAGVTFNAGYSCLKGQISSSGVNQIAVLEEGTSGIQALPVSQIASTTTLRFAGSYFVSA